MNDVPHSGARALPSVSSALERSEIRALIEEHGRDVVLVWLREQLDALRQRVLAHGAPHDRAALLETLIDSTSARAATAEAARIGHVINATGVILHTGLGRAPLSTTAKAALAQVAGAGNVEVDLDSGERRYRGHQLQPTWHALTGCEDSLIVNNNAAATLLALQALCAGREVIISRGQLIEIGGSFRLPEIFTLSGARLREVGTTNRTHLADYERAIGTETAAILHVHSSNYRIVGFTESPGIAELAPLAHAHGLIAIDDIGSGSLVDVTRFGLPWEPTFPASIAAGADLVLGSGDKLLGGPQAGILLGRSQHVDAVRRHPLARAVRVDKLTLAALSATLAAYLRGRAEAEIPTLGMLASSFEQLFERANAIREELGNRVHLQVDVATDTAPVGGGTLPAVELQTAVLRLTHRSLPAQELARRLRTGRIRLFPRVQAQTVVIDLRSVPPEEDSRITLALRLVDENPGPVIHSGPIH